MKIPKNPGDVYITFSKDAPTPQSTKDIILPITSCMKRCFKQEPSFSPTHTLEEPLIASYDSEGVPSDQSYGPIVRAAPFNEPLFNTKRPLSLRTRVTMCFKDTFNLLKEFVTFPCSDYSIKGKGYRVLNAVKK